VKLVRLGKEGGNLLVGLGTVYATLNMPNMKKNEGKEGKKRTPAHEQRLIKREEKKTAIFFRFSSVFFL